VRGAKQIPSRGWKKTGRGKDDAKMSSKGSIPAKKALETGKLPQVKPIRNGHRERMAHEPRGGRTLERISRLYRKAPLCLEGGRPTCYLYKGGKGFSLGRRLNHSRRAEKFHPLSAEGATSTNERRGVI